MRVLFAEDRHQHVGAGDSFLPDDWTCRMARWMTRWKPRVGWVSMSSVPSTRGCAR